MAGAVSGKEISETESMSANDVSGQDADDTVSGNTPTDDSAAQDRVDEAAEQDGPEENAAQEDIRRAPVKVKGIYVSGPVAGIAKMDELIDLVDRTELNAMVIDIKNDEGKVTYKMQSEQVLEIDAGVRYISDSGIYLKHLLRLHLIGHFPLVILNINDHGV